MAQIVSNELELDCIPQSAPRTRVNPIYKHSPKLRKKCLYSLSDAAYQGSLLFAISCCYHQHFGFFYQISRYLLAFIAPITNCYSHITHKRQPNSSLSITQISQSQKSTYKLPIDVYRSVQLESKEPSFAGFAKVCPIFSQQSHTTVTNRVTHGYWLRIEDEHFTIESVAVASRFNEMTNNFTQLVKSSHPSLIRAKAGKS